MPRSFLMPMVALVLIFTTCAMGTTTKGTYTTIDGKISIAILLPYFSEQTKVDNVTKTFAQYLFKDVTIGNDVKISVVALDRNASAIVLVNQSNLGAVSVKTAIGATATNAGGDQAHGLAFEKMQQLLSGTTKAAIVFIAAVSKDREEAKEKARLLRGTGAFIYVIFNKDDKSVMADAESYAGSKSRIIGMPSKNFSKMAVDKISEVVRMLTRDRCKYCRISGAMAEDRKPPPPIDIECKMVKGFNCTKADCETECDRVWPWKTKPNCSSVKCGTSINRKTVKPPQNMEHCLAEITCPCDDAAKKPKEKSIFEEHLQLIIIGAAVGGAVLCLIILVVVVVVIKKSRAKKKLKAEAAEKLNKLYALKKDLMASSKSPSPSMMGKGKEGTSMISKRDGKSMVGGKSKIDRSTALKSTKPPAKSLKPSLMKK